MSRYAILILFFHLSFSGFPQFIKNENASDAFQNLTGGAADWGDYDNDGDLDLAIAGGLGGLYAQIYRNDNGTFIDINADLKEAFAPALMWGDFDNDGDLDLLYSGQSTEGVGVDRVTIFITRIYRNDSGIFTDHNANLLGTDGGSTEWGDYDNDGDLDVATIGITIDGDLILKIYENDNGIFTDLMFPDQPNHTGVTGSINWGDFDNDNDLDLLVTGLGWNEARDDYVTTVFRNDAGTFVDAGINLPGLVESDGKWGDYDNDGDLDIVLAGSNFNDQYNSYIYQNTNGEFTDIGAQSVDIRHPHITWVDYDTDHDLDLIISGLNNLDDYIPKFFKNENGTFVDTAIQLPSTWEDIVSRDYDKDGDPDLLFFEVGEKLAPFTNLYENEFKSAQTISFDAIPDKTFGDPDFNLVASASSELTITYKVVSGPALVNGNTVTITGAGNIVIEALQLGNIDFNPAIPTQQTFSVSKAPLTVTADDKTITYGNPLPNLSFSYSGFINGQDASVLTAEPAIGTAATANSDAGTYAISLSGGSATNYDLLLIDGFLTIEKANATITFADLEQIADGTEKEATITTEPLGLDYSATYDGSEALPLEPGSYDLVVTISDVNYQGQSSATFLIQLISGTEDLLRDIITIYPMPSDLEIHFKGGLNNLERVQIHNLNGQILLDEAFEKGQRLDISHIRAGSYILSLVDQNGIKKLTETILIK